MSRSQLSSTIQIVFSDVDGTLVHYPPFDDQNDKSDQKSQQKRNDEDKSGLLYLPPSSTGMRGIISYKTLSLCSKIRSISIASPNDNNMDIINHSNENTHVKLVLVSGMRTSTLMARLPFLPVADAYCSEGGGRIFYTKSPAMLPINNNEEGMYVTIHPKSGEPPFQLVEDMEWRQIMNQQDAAGSQGYENEDEIVLNKDFMEQNAIKIVPIEERSGLLWDFARDLMKQGWVLDTKGYATCFRINLKKQKDPTLMEAGVFQNLPSKIPKGLACSVNLGCIDFYPMASGKKNCCKYLVHKYLQMDKDSLNPPRSSMNSKSNGWVCLCDDDNDIEMALFCHHAYIPSVTSQSMQSIIKSDPNHFSVTCDAKLQREGVLATEHALQLILGTFETTMDES